MYGWRCERGEPAWWNVRQWSTTSRLHTTTYRWVGLQRVTSVRHLQIAAGAKPLVRLLQRSCRVPAFLSDVTIGFSAHGSRSNGVCPSLRKSSGGRFSVRPIRHWLLAHSANSILWSLVIKYFWWGWCARGQLPHPLPLVTPLPFLPSHHPHHFPSFSLSTPKQPFENQSRPIWSTVS